MPPLTESQHVDAINILANMIRDQVAYLDARPRNNKDCEAFAACLQAYATLELLEGLHAGMTKLDQVLARLDLKTVKLPNLDRKPEKP